MISAWAAKSAMVTGVESGFEISLFELWEVFMVVRTFLVAREAR